MNIANIAYSARCTGAWLALAALIASFGLQLSAELRESRTVGPPAAALCIQPTSGGARVAPN